MPRCAFLTMDNLEEFEAYDDLLIEPMANLGWSVEMVSWRKQNADWNAFEAVIIRSPWDYQQEVGQFLNVLETIDRSSARLENPLQLVRWNINKTYLKELETEGIPVVPTLWGATLQANHLQQAFERLHTREIVVKPTISAGAEDTFWLSEKAVPSNIESVIQRFSEKSFMIQPFMEHILTEGEYSLFYFGGEYSHTILKTPKKRDFRVQEEHGGTLTTVEPEPGLLERAKQTMNRLNPQPLYARVDLVRTTGNDFALMELELIEPSLYFNMDPESPKRFARIFDEWMTKKNVV